MALSLFNTLSLKVEPFTPADGRTVRMYSCGPTVYNYAHIGNLRTFTFNDTLRRFIGNGEMHECSRRQPVHQ